MTVKNFVGICVLTASLAFGFWGCSSSDSSEKNDEKDDPILPSGHFQLGGVFCASMAIDDSGNIYCGGNAREAIGEGFGGNTSDIFVVKMNSTGTIEWMTQFGDTTLGFAGGDNSGYENCKSIAVDDTGVYCGGYTSGALGEPNGGAEDAFVMKLDLTDGSVDWVTQFGATTVGFAGGDNSDIDICNSIAVNDTGVYCGGVTYGAIGEAFGGGQDAFVMKLNLTDGTIGWVTQLGATTVGSVGGDNSVYDACSSVAVDDTGVYCGGDTEGALGEAFGGGTTDAFVMKLNLDGTIAWMTHLGATTVGFVGGDNSFKDYCSSIAVDGTGVYCGGKTLGALGEAFGGGDEDDAYDAFVMKLNLDGTIGWVTQLGDTTVGFVGGDNSFADACASIAVDGTGVYCGGSTYGAIGEANGGNQDAFVMKLDLTDGSVEWVNQLGSTTFKLEGYDNSSYDACNSVVASDTGVYCAIYSSTTIEGIEGGSFITKFSQ